jgi:hypothetical protein
MASPQRRFLRLTKEAAWGTYATGGATLWPHLSSSNAFTPPQKPRYWSVMSGDGWAVPVMAGTQQMEMTTTLVTEVGISVAEFLVAAGCERISDDQTAPWTTAELPGDLASFTADFAMARFDLATLKRKRYVGGKVSSVGLACSVDQNKLMGTFGMMFGKMVGNHFDGSTDPDATAFPAPDCDVHPTDIFLFQHLKGKVNVLGSAVTNFDSFSLQIQNKMKPYYDEEHFPNAIRCNGRDVKIDLRCRFKASPDYWDAWEQGTEGASSFEFNDGTNFLKFDMGAKAYINDLQPDLPIDEEHYYTITLVNMLDTATCNDFTVTYGAVTPP